MQTEEPSQFRFTPQVAVILLVTGFALMVPLALVAVAVRDLFAPPVAAEAPAIAAPLQEALEKAAGDNLAPAALSSGDRNIVREVADIARERDRIEKLARQEGLVALPASSDDPETVGLLIQVPASRADAFVQMCKGLLPDESSPTTPNDGSGVLVEVVIKKKSP